MESLFITPDEFWNWFDREKDESSSASCPVDFGATKIATNKKKRKIESAPCGSKRYRILWGRHRPGKKHKVWEEDGFLSLFGTIAHVVDEKGRPIEEPTLLDDTDLEAVRNLGEIVVGNTEIQIQEEEISK